MARRGGKGHEESYSTREERRALEAGKCLCVAGGGCAGDVPCEQSAIMQPSSRGEWRAQEESGSGEGDTILGCSGVDAVQ